MKKLFYTSVANPAGDTIYLIEPLETYGIEVDDEGNPVCDCVGSTITSFEFSLVKNLPVTEAIDLYTGEECLTLGQVKGFLSWAKMWNLPVADYKDEKVSCITRFFKKEGV
jgi:hypothetical protein